jgi:DNA-binding MarR family transcriptional regulator
MLENKEWYDQQELADAWGVPVARVRSTTTALEAVGAIVTRDKPGDRRAKQIRKDSIENLKSAVGV